MFDGISPELCTSVCLMFMVVLGWFLCIIYQDPYWSGLLHWHCWPPVIGGLLWQMASNADLWLCCSLTWLYLAIIFYYSCSTNESDGNGAKTLMIFELTTVLIYIYIYMEDELEMCVVRKHDCLLERIDAPRRDTVVGEKFPCHGVIMCWFTAQYIHG